MSEALRQKALQSSAETLLKLIDSKADEECPLDDKEEWSPEDDEHECPVCLARSAYNSIAGDIRNEFVRIFSMKKEE